MRMRTLKRNIQRYGNGWLWISLIGAVVIPLPILHIVSSLFQKPNDNWAHIKEYLLLKYALNSLQLVLWTGALTVVIGITLAWLITAYDFPLRRFFNWALTLPLAVPPYIAAYTYSTMFGYTGVVQSTLRNHFGLVLPQEWFNLMSMRGAVFIFTLFLYPYVYLMTRTFLERQCASYVESARLLGQKPLGIFVRVVLPLSRPALAAAAALVVFEVLSDYGVSSYFGIPTVSVAIFRTWFGMYDLDSASRLAAWLMAVLIGLLIVERLLRKRQSFSPSTSKTRPLKLKALRGVSALAAVLFCLFIFSLAFLIPVLQLITWAGWTYDEVLTPAFWDLIRSTLFVSLAAAAIVMMLSAVVANTCRHLPVWLSVLLSRVVTSGYSIPGTIVAIGILALFTAIDHALSPVYARIGLGEDRLVLSMSVAMLICGYVVRFMAIGYNAVETGFEKTGKTYTEAARVMGLGMTETFFRVDLRFIAGSLGSGLILTFVEIVKELPLALLLRPFNFDTLATKVYQYAGDEQIIEASIPSLCIIGISLISVVAIHHFGRRSNS
ncbi:MULTISPECIES: ABC transporter permease [Brevibacillus]|jgi:iron(III) transport system permease protein|uniref:Iron ABC transporter permease n=1 Tax=Brevibacillus thermoruber TaxID=33942 RepID=A0A9X3TNI1_9BACL|nr:MULTISPECIES: iron ABC transporter permease [Brevibacillus]MDA5107622.1 iron ABC transporter permease [Brevibacillus thermoruber]